MKTVVRISYSSIVVLLLIAVIWHLVIVRLPLVVAQYFVVELLTLSVIGLIAALIGLCTSPSPHARAR